MNWVADWLLPRPQGINAVTVNLIGCIEKLHRMRLKTGCNCDVHNKPDNNIILGCNSEILAFMFPFGSVAKQSLAKL